MNIILSFIFSFSILYSYALSADNVEELMRKVMQEYKIPGMSVVVIQNGESKIYSLGVSDPKSKKPVRENTLFELASVTKVFTATAIAVEVQNKRMNLTDPIKKYFPHLRAAENKDINKVTLEQLLTHTSSLPRMPEWSRGNKDKANVFRFLKDWEADYPIGSKYLYSNLSFGLAGFALEEETGSQLIEIYRRLILRPLGMDHTEIEVSPKNRPYLAHGLSRNGEEMPPMGPFVMPGGGALKSDARDMEKFLAANMGIKGPPNLIQAMKFAQQERFQANKKLNLGLGWQNTQLQGLRLLDKNGGVPGFSSYIGFIPEKKLGIVILANRAGIDSTKIGRNLLKALLK